jgi:hypothetical protein
MASYAEFDGLVRQALLWLGLADPLESQTRLIEANPEEKNC